MSTLLPKVALVGINGFGRHYLNQLLDKSNWDRLEFVGAVDPFADRCERLGEITGNGIPVCAHLEELYSHSLPDLLVISSPIHLHAHQSCFGLAQGSNVLCEKPLCAVVQDADRMIEARDKAGKFLAIGYQWSFSDPILSLKRDILSGRLGAPRRLSSMVLWPRDEKYYRRNGWAGKLKTLQGDWILDSPVANAAAHFLHNIFYLLGNRIDSSATPRDIVAELYRANPIENYDTAFLRSHTTEGTEILFSVSHATEQKLSPLLRLEFERAIVQSGSSGSDIVADFDDGTRENYGNPESQNNAKLWTCLSGISGITQIPCGPEAARAQVLCVNGAQLSMPEIADLPSSMIYARGEIGSRINTVRGLDQVMFSCFDSGKLPSEMGIDWARSGKTVDLTSLRAFS